MVERPAVFVFNHQSNLDPIVVGALLRRDFTSTGKKEARSDPMAALAGYVLDAVLPGPREPGARQAADRRGRRAPPRRRLGDDRPRGHPQPHADPGAVQARAPSTSRWRRGCRSCRSCCRNSGELMPRGSSFIRPGTARRAGARADPDGGPGATEIPASAPPSAAATARPPGRRGCRSGSGAERGAQTRENRAPGRRSRPGRARRA